nr:zf-HC2 domain-containing protein [Anaerolineae bacterium]
MADNPQTDLEYIRDLLSPYIDGEVTAEERRQVESALADSAELQQELESLQQTVLLLKHLPTMPAPRPFTLSEADVQPIRPAKKRPFWLSGWFGGLAAATAAVICVTVVFFNQSMSMGGALQQADVAMAPAVQNAEAPAESGAVPPGEAETAAEAAPAAEELMQSAAVEEESAEDTVTAADSTAVERYAAEAAESAAAPAEGAAREAEPAPPAPSPSSTGTFAAEADAAAAQPVEPETRVEAEAEAPV